MPVVSRESDSCGGSQEIAGNAKARRTDAQGRTVRKGGGEAYALTSVHCCASVRLVVAFPERPLTISPGPQRRHLPPVTKPRILCRSCLLWYASTGSRSPPHRSRGCPPFAGRHDRR